MRNDEPLVLTDRWSDLGAGGVDEDDARQHFLTEINRETSYGHPLHGLGIGVVGINHASDDVLLQTADGRWALVHLTWKHPDIPPWPSTTFFNSVAEVEAELRNRD